MMERENPSGHPDKLPKKRGPEKGAMRKIAEAAGISRHQMYQYLQIANVPEGDFEAALAAPKKPTSTELARIGRGEQPKIKTAKSAPLKLDVCPHCGGLM